MSDANFDYFRVDEFGEEPNDFCDEQFCKQKLTHIKSPFGVKWAASIKWNSAVLQSKIHK